MSAGQLTREEVLAGNYAGGHFTPEQGRVLYHQERIFRSTGGGIKAHARYLALCEAAALPALVTRWSLPQCVQGLQLIERASRDVGLHYFRDVRTQWEPIAERAAIHPDLHRVTHV
jgi:hypothetical protein